jgi:hypothetical protein
LRLSVFYVGVDLKFFLLSLCKKLKMNQGKMVFSQIMDFASQDVFKNIVSRYKGNYKTKDFSSWKHFLCLSFGQLTHRESMSDAMLCLKLNSQSYSILGLEKLLINPRSHEQMKIETGGSFRILG